MKIRILDNQLRLRLAPLEVECIGRGEAVRGRTPFPQGACFHYRLAVDDADGVVAAGFGDGTIEVRLGADLAARWAGTESEISIERMLSTTAGSLRVLVEKDFECLEPRPGESRANRFPNPKAAG